MENLLSKDRKKLRRQDPSMSIRDWLRDLSQAEWALSDDVEVREVQFKDGLLTVKLGKVVPEHHARKNYL